MYRSSIIHVLDASLILTLPQSDPEFSFTIIEGAGMALKRVETQVSDKENELLIIGAEWLRLAESVEGSIVLLNKYIHNSEFFPDLVEMNMKIYTVDMNIATLVDFGTLYMAIGMTTDEHADWSMSAEAGAQFRPIQSIVNIENEVRDMVIFMQVDMQVDGSKMIEPYQYGALTMNQPRDMSAISRAPLEFAWMSIDQQDPIDSVSTWTNLDFIVRSCPVNPKPEDSLYRDVFEFTNDDISLTTNVDSSYLIGIDGSRVAFNIRDVAVKAVFIDQHGHMRRRFYSQLSNEYDEEGRQTHFMSIHSSPIFFPVHYIRLKVYQASKPKGSKRILSCVDLKW